jgi:hypothetical protein
MKPNRIVINFDDPPPVASGRGNAPGRRSSRRAIGRVLALIAILLVLIVGGLAAGGYFWWQHYQSSPAYTLAVLVDATHRNDRQTIDSILDTDKIATDFVSQIRGQVPARELWASQIDLAKMSSSAKVKETLHDQLVKELQRLTEVAAGKPFIIVALAVPGFAEIKQEGNTAHATVTLREEQIQLTMVADGGRWRITAVKDEKLASMIAQAIMTNFPVNGGRIQDELQRQLNNLPNLGR